ncbi:hypothetical protein C8A03DRAFT_31812 [Achaetomium macrosporum]|uniref:CFEM domain-containing protein n=1 Tax=Achaetomium macrosporum TaxID=79813 RepID=A0AAN7CDI9_9PEZI|nr:hypothetical protein C8A03DRAFT_31812 [Achaetomium macrosporum]
MLGIQSLTLFALAALASAQAIDSLDPCGRQCYTAALNNAGTFNCAANDMNCLCRIPDWGFAIRDCAVGACPPGYAPTVTNAASAVCATATAGAAVTTSSSTSQATPTTTEVPSSSSASSSQVSSTTTVSSSTSTTLDTSTITSTASTTSATVPSKATTSSTSSASAAGTVSDVENVDDSGSSDSGSSGLSEAAKIGIGVGIGAAVIALLAVTACVFLRKRRAERAAATKLDRFKISHPMPSDEHAYTHNNGSEYDIGSGELEMKSRRYEDMLPRQQPRQMV